MLNKQRDWIESSGNGVLVKKLQETLRLGKHITNSKLCEDACRQAAELENRLLRVRSWGGAFSEIDFSPDIKLILKGSEKIRKKRVLVL